MYLPEFTRAALTNVRKLAEQPLIDEFDPRSAVSAVLNPPDGPRRLVGLPYTDAITDEALQSAVAHSSSNPEEPALSFWFVVAFACTHAEQLPLQVQDVDAAAHFVMNMI